MKGPFHVHFGLRCRDIFRGCCCKGGKDDRWCAYNSLQPAVRRSASVFPGRARVPVCECGTWLADLRGPPGELAIHPVEERAYHELYLMCRILGPKSPGCRPRGSSLRCPLRTKGGAAQPEEITCSPGPPRVKHRDNGASGKARLRRIALRQRCSCSLLVFLLPRPYRLRRLKISSA